MLINWFTVFAQMLNFLLLLALLRWVLYQPILRVMEQRQARLEQRWQEAERLQAEAEQALQTYQQQQQELQRQQAARLTRVRLAVEQERQHLLAELQQEMAGLRTRWQVDWRQEQDAWLRTLRQQIVKQACAIARQALGDLANAELEQQMVQMFCELLGHLEPQQHQAIAQALGQNHQPLLIRSSFELPPNLRQQVMETLQTQFGVASPAVEFVTAANLLCGIALKLSGQEIIWSLDTYLQALEQRLATALTLEGKSDHDSHLSAGAGCLH